MEKKSECKQFYAKVEGNGKLITPNVKLTTRKDAIKWIKQNEQKLDKGVEYLIVEEKYTYYNLTPHL